MTNSKRAIEILEDLPLRADDAWYVALVYKGVRPGALLQLSSTVWRKGDPVFTVPQETLKHIEDSLTKLGIYCSIEKRNVTWGLDQPLNGRARYNQLCNIYIARSQKEAKVLMEAHQQGDDTKFGLLLGYPPTAVEAFGTDNTWNASKIKLDSRTSRIARFTYFMPSKDHWQEELEVVQYWMDTLKDTSDLLWNRLEAFAS